MLLKYYALRKCVVYACVHINVCVCVHVCVIVVCREHLVHCLAWIYMWAGVAWQSIRPPSTVFASIQSSSLFNNNIVIVVFIITRVYVAHARWTLLHVGPVTCGAWMNKVLGHTGRKEQMISFLEKILLSKRLGQGNHPKSYILECIEQREPNDGLYWWFIEKKVGGWVGKVQCRSLSYKQTWSPLTIYSIENL